MTDSNKIPVIDKAMGETRYVDPPDIRSRPESTVESSNTSTSEWASEVAGTAGPVAGVTTPTVDSDVQTDGMAGTKQAVPNKRFSSEKKGKPKQDIETLEQFIASAYAKKGRKVVLERKIEKQICNQPRLEPDALERLLKLSEKDVLFSVPRQLLLVARDIVGYPALKGALREFVREVMLGHPLFKRPELVAAVQNLPEAPSVPDSFGILANSEPSLVPKRGDEPIMKPTDFAELRLNAVYCLAVWFAETRGLSRSVVNEALYSALWSRQSKKLENETAKLRALTEVRDLAAVGLACNEFKQLAAERARAAEAALRAESIAKEKVEVLGAELERARASHAKQEEDIRALKQALENEKFHSEIAQTHLRDDLTQQRTRLLRRLKADVELLDEGLLALRRDPPKMHVMDDHAERVVDALRQEIKKLESGE